MSPDQPHDGLFQFAWSDLATARSHFQEVLPPDVVAGIDWSTLASRPGHFVDEVLKHLHSDLLFEVLTRDRRPIRLYLLFEHQSTPDGLMPFRLLRYMVRIWDRQRRADPPEPLVPIIPLVLFHGAEAWAVPEDLAGMLHLEPEDLERFGRYLPSFRYEVQDLSTVPDEAIRGTALRRIALLLLKHARDGDLWERLPGWLELVKQVRDERADGLRAVEALMRYLVLVSSRPPGPETRAAVREQLGARTEEKLMTWAEQLREEGREESRREAQRAERREGQRSIEQVLARRFPGRRWPGLEEALCQASLSVLFAVHADALTASTAAEFEAALARRVAGEE